ncbi:MAG: winged helix-turn-helix transcriptional regulator [Frankiaceae bacterium]
MPPRKDTRDAATGNWPLAELIELLGRRGALTAMWQLRSGPVTFRGLATRAGLPDPQASQRLRELREAGLIEVDEVGDYRLTAEGRRLQGVLEHLASYAERWSQLTHRQRVPRGAAAVGRGEPGGDERRP